jgi:hypothetical protein
LNSITLTGFSSRKGQGGGGIFDFDGDGACEAGRFGGAAYDPAPPAADCLDGQYWPGFGSGSNTYESVDVSFSDITTTGGHTKDTGTVNFDPLAENASTWFSLEGRLTTSNLNDPAAPEPGTLALMGTGLCALAATLGRRRPAGADQEPQASRAAITSSSCSSAPAKK